MNIFSIFRGAIFSSFFLRALNVILTSSIPLFFIRKIGLHEYGAYAYAISIAMIFSMFSQFGLETLAVREVAFARAEKKFYLVSLVLSYGILILSAFSALVIIFLRILDNYDIIKMQLNHSSYLVIFIIIFTAATLRFAQGFLQGMGLPNFGQFPVMVVGPAAILLCAGVTFFGLNKAGAEDALRAHAGGLVIAAIASAFFVIRSLCALRGIEPATSGKRQGTGWRELFEHAGAWSRSTCRVWAGSLAGLVNDKVGVLVLGTLVSKSAAGTFDVMWKLAAVIALPLMAANVVVAPRIATAFKKKKLLEVESEIRRVVRVCGVLAALAFVLVLGLRDWLLGIMHIGAGAGGPGGAALTILGAAQLINVLAGPVALIMNMTGREIITLQGMAAALAINTVLAIILAPRLGIPGAATAAFVALVGWNVYLAWQVYREHGLNPTVTAARIGRLLTASRKK